MSEKKQIEDLLLDDSFIRFIKGRAAQHEEDEWRDWLKKNPHHKALLEQAEAFVAMTARPQSVIPDPQVELKHFQRLLTYSLRNQSYQSHSKQHNIAGRGRSYWGALTAALVLIAVTAGILFKVGNTGGQSAEEEVLQVVSNSEHQTAYGEKAYLHLPDGSRIVLNANSYLTYLNRGIGTDGETIVEVFLEGEALFEITPSNNEDIPRNFKVQTPHGSVDVRGTVFWVESTVDYTRTILEEGAVRVSKSAGPESEVASELILKPGEMAQFSIGDDLIEVKKVNTKIYTSWTTNVWTFDQTAVKEIAMRMEKVFGKKVEILSADLIDKTLSGTISSDNLQLIKEGLSMVLGEEVTEADGTIYIGTE